jgi:hypothetical protein
MIDSAIAEIEDAFEGHWRRFGLYPGARLVEESGVLRFESPLAHLPYNAVIRTRITLSDDPERVLHKLMRNTAPGPFRICGCCVRLISRMAWARSCRG